MDFTQLNGEAKEMSINIRIEWTGNTNEGVIR